MKVATTILGVICGILLLLIVSEDAFLRQARDAYCAEHPECLHCSFVEDYTNGVSFYGIDHGQRYRVRRIPKVLKKGRQFNN
jgi:hypothetical protein